MRELLGRPPLTRAVLVAILLAAFGGGVARAAPPQGGLLPALLPGLAVPAPGPPSPPPAAAPGANPCATAAVPGDSTVLLTSAGFTRTAVLHLPRAAAGRAVPLIIAFHGQGSDGPHFAVDSGLSTLGDEQGFAVVYPSSVGPKWLIAGPDRRDVVFASDLLDRVQSLACVDARRVYATGVSIGAGMAARTGCEESSRIAALVLVAGGYRSLGPCTPDRPLSFLEIHGTFDASVPYHGRGPGSDGAVLPYVQGWATRDRCAPRPTKRLVAAHVVLYRWSGCASGVVVEHLRIYGSGHGLPNAAGSEISAGNRSRVSGVRNIWHFLAARTLEARFPDRLDASPGH